MNILAPNKIVCKIGKIKVAIVNTNSALSNK